jgi:uncharacterized protein YacL
MIASVIILGLVGWIVAFLLLCRSIKEDREKNYKVIHFSAIKDGRVGKLFKFGIIEGIPVISEEDMKKIAQYLESNDIPEGFKDNLRLLKELDLKIINAEAPDICKALKCPAITAGDDKNKLEIQGIECINIKDLDKIGKSNLIKGERISINNVDYGYDRAEGFLEDGTIVEIKGEIPENRPVSIECIVEAIIESRAKRKVFARIADND